jgi:cysteine desulfurase
MAEDIIYLDYNATTPVDPQVLTEMLPYFTKNFANAASFSHAPGRLSSQAVDKARQQIADLINAQPGNQWPSGVLS